MTLYFRQIRDAQRFVNALSRLTTSEIAICREDELYRVQANDVNQDSGVALRELLEQPGARADRITLQDVVNHREGLDLKL